ncbi:non-ribosomal peptide synthetase [Gordonia sp. LSe1-13]|uniref:Non-ribosomal peptide synthetase n=1 Tax=Gordonia sesuvii TaxID=3116777 RepID=A0ABU7MHP4_9ACTN|nr:non-ribosomal peptide synthetase [Gordonia sp. LSe1-13]
MSSSDEMVPAQPHTPTPGDPASSTAAARWREIASTHTDEVAICTPESSITFGRAAALVEAQARAIAAFIDDPARPVAVDIECDVDSVVAMLSVVCSGHPLVPLDPFLPADRRAHILRLSDAIHLGPGDIAALPPAAAPAPEPAPEDPAVLIFTSGSTGTPKGVVLSQKMQPNHAQDGRDFMELGRGDRAAVLLPLSFGGGLDGMSMSLLNGATMHLWDVRRRTAVGLRDWLDAEQVTTVHCTPSLLRSWLGELAGENTVDSVRLLSTCGEPSYGGDIELFRTKLAPQGTFCVWAGASEVGDLAFNVFGPDREVPTGVLGAGRPATDKQIRVIDENDYDVAAGSIGEVIVESAHIALRYHGDPEMTARRFSRIDDGRTRYRTGDLGRFDESGRLQLLGRGDDAIKIRGYLVEPLEVEAAVRELPWTVDAAVTADRDAARLAAYIAIDPAKWSPSTAEIRKELGKSLAAWMIPQDIVVVAEIPRNERGKVDRAALPTPPPPSTPEPPRGLTERGLHMLWCEVLGLESVGRNDDFFALGGDSLAAATMVTEVREHLQVEVTTAMLNEGPTIAEFAASIETASKERSKNATGATIVQLRPGTGRPIFLIAGAGSLGTSLTPLARALDTDRPVVAIQARGIEKRARADRSVRKAAARAVSDIRSVQPDGPYQIGGYSLGGFLAVEAAAQLARDGQACDEVIVLDSVIDPILADRLRAGRFGLLSRLPFRRSSLSSADEVLPDRTGDENPTPKAPLPARVLQQVGQRVLVHLSGLVRLPPVLQWVVFFNLGTRMIRRHRPSPYSGAITVVRARTNTDGPELWGFFTTGPVRTVDIDADHNSMIRVPHVSQTAGAMESVLGKTPAASGVG